MKAVASFLRERWYVIVFALVAGTFLQLVVLAAFDLEPPRREIVVTPDKTAYRPGELASGEYSALAVRECEGSGRRWLSMDGRPDWSTPLFPDEVQPLDPGTPLPVRITVEVPPFSVPSVPAGSRLYLHRRVTFLCNWLQRLVPDLGVVVDYPVMPLDVLPGRPMELGRLGPSRR